jgi:hypothetical protein
MVNEGGMKRKKSNKPVKLDISDNFQPTADGYERLDQDKLPLDGSVDEILMNGVLEQTPGKLRPAIMRRIHKTLKVGGKARFSAAHWASAAASMSPFSEWPPLSPEAMGFFSKDVRERSSYKNPKLEDINFDLSWSEIYPPDWTTKADSVRQFAAKHYTNVLMGMDFVLVKKGK